MGKNLLILVLFTSVCFGSSDSNSVDSGDSDSPDEATGNFTLCPFNCCVNTTMSNDTASISSSSSDGGGSSRRRILSSDGSSSSSEVSMAFNGTCICIEVNTTTGSSSSSLSSSSSSFSSDSLSGLNTTNSSSNSSSSDSDSDSDSSEDMASTRRICIVDVGGNITTTPPVVTTTTTPPPVNCVTLGFVGGSGTSCMSDVDCIIIPETCVQVSSMGAMACCDEGENPPPGRSIFSNLISYGGNGKSKYGEKFIVIDEKSFVFVGAVILILIIGASFCVGYRCRLCAYRNQVFTKRGASIYAKLTQTDTQTDSNNVNSSGRSDINNNDNEIHV